jgi:hypothetical protein
MTTSGAHVPSFRTAILNHHFEIAALDAIAAAGNGRSWLAGLFQIGHAYRRCSIERHQADRKDFF